MSSDFLIIPDPTCILLSSETRQKRLTVGMAVPFQPARSAYRDRSVAPTPDTTTTTPTTTATTSASTGRPPPSLLMAGGAYALYRHYKNKKKLGRCTGERAAVGDRDAASRLWVMWRRETVSCPETPGFSGLWFALLVERHEPV